MQAVAAPRLVAGVEYSVGQSMVRASKTSPITRVVASILTLVLGVPAFCLVAPIWLLVMRNKVRSQHMASIFIPRLMKSMDSAFRNVKHELLKEVKTGRVLDVGCGGGGWLPYFENKHELSCITELEPNTHLIPVIEREVAAFRARSPQSKDVKIEVVNKFVHELADGEKYDHIIFGNVMCEVPNQAQFLRDIDLVIKPGGRVYFLEHVKRQEGTWTALLQDWFNPFWVRASDGCNCNRNTLKMLQAHPGFERVEHWELQSDGPPFVNLVVAGICIAKGGPVATDKSKI